GAGRQDTDHSAAHAMLRVRAPGATSIPRSRALTRTRGVILQASYRVVTQPGGRRAPVVHLYGRLEDGGAFLVRDDRQQPHFFIRAGEIAQARNRGASEPLPTAKRDFTGGPVAQINVSVPSDV